jgi:uncharacterized repeat protein (TIGR01451 family)
MKQYYLLAIILCSCLSSTYAQFGAAEELLPLGLNNKIKVNKSIDYDGDGDQDLVQALQGYGFSIVNLNLNDGQGNLVYSSLLWKGDQAISSMEIMDLNDDGYNDLIFDDGLWFNNAPVIGVGGVYAVEYVRLGSTAPARPIHQNGALGDGGYKFEDVDDDGDLDFLIAQNFGTYNMPVWNDLWLLQTSDFVFSGTLPSTIDNSKEVVDMDNDGLADMAIPFVGTQSIYLRKNYGQGVFGPYLGIGMNANDYKGIEDFNFDGLPDLYYVESAAGYTGGLVEIYKKMNQGNFTFSNAQLLTSFSMSMRFMVLVDYDFDGDKDLMLKSVDGSINYVALNDGNWVFGSPIVVPTNEFIYTAKAAENNWRSSNLIDMDGNGSIDALPLDPVLHCGFQIKYDIGTTWNGPVTCYFDHLGHVASSLANVDADPELEFMHLRSADYENAHTGIQDNPLQFDLDNIVPVSDSLSNYLVFGSYFFFNTDQDSAMESVQFTASETRVIVNDVVNGTMTQMANNYFGNYSYNRFGIGDFNTDGLVDIYFQSDNVGSTSGDLFILKNLGNHLFDDITFPDFEFDQIMQVLDFTNDGFNDFIYLLGNELYCMPMDANYAMGTPFLISSDAADFECLIGNAANGWALLKAYSFGGTNFLGEVSGLNADAGYVTLWTQDELGIFSVMEQFVNVNSFAIADEIDHHSGIDALFRDGLMISMVNGQLVVQDTFEGDSNFDLDYFTQEINYLRNTTSMKDVDSDGISDLVWQRNNTATYNGSYSVGKFCSWRKSYFGLGCTDSQACNYDVDAIISSGDCCYDACGCTDSTACNFDPSATCDNGTCTLAGCTDPTACNYDEAAVCDDGSCNLTDLHLEARITSLLNGSQDIGPVTWLTPAEYPSSSLWNVTDIMGEMALDSSGVLSIDYGCVPANCYAFQFGYIYPFDNDDQLIIELLQNGNTISYNDYLLIESFPVLDWICLCPEEVNMGCLNEFAMNYDPEADCHDGRCIFEVAGRVFFDQNQNGVFDGSDYGLAYQEVNIYPEEITLITNDQGFYVAQIPGGYFSISHQYDPAFPNYTTPSSYNFVSGGSVLPVYNFGVTSEPIIGEFVVHCSPFVYICNTTVNYNINILNTAGYTLDGIVTIEIDSLFLGYTMETPIDSVVGNFIYLSFEDLLPGQMYFYDLGLMTPSADFIGEILNTSVWVNTPPDAEVIVSGFGSCSNTHSCSYDPNDKQGFPVGHTDAHFVEEGTSIEYLIRFQNTGSAPAYNVRIEDLIDPNLDIESFELLISSHSVSTSLNQETRELVFYFNDILLPDSTNNEPESHGFVSYRMRINDNLDNGIVVNNTAEIYFDFNDPVVTNTTFHTIFDCEAYAASYEIVSAENCGGTEFIVASTAAWTENYTWSLDSVLVGDASNYVCTSPGTHLLELVVENPLCGERYFSQTVIVEEPIFAAITGTDLDICSGESVSFIAEVSDGQWSWDLDGEDLGNAASVSIAQTGLLTLHFVSGDCELMEQVNIVDAASPVIGGVLQNQNTLSVTQVAEAVYQWFYNGVAIEGANAHILEIDQSGLYSVEVAWGNCTESFELTAEYVGVALLNGSTWSVYPNPTTGFISLFNGLSQSSQLVIYNAIGQEVKQLTILPGMNLFDLTDLPIGMYNCKTFDTTVKLVLVK